MKDLNINQGFEEKVFLSRVRKIVI